jgi:hypothetical protein
MGCLFAAVSFEQDGRSYVGDKDMQPWGLAFSEWHRIDEQRVVVLGPRASGEETTHFKLWGQ